MGGLGLIIVEGLHNVDVVVYDAMVGVAIEERNGRKRAGRMEETRRAREGGK